MSGKILLVLLAFVLWLLLGWWWLGNSKCLGCEQTKLANTANVAPILSGPNLTIRDSNWSLEAIGNYRFKKSEFNPVIIGGVKTAMDSLAAYISKSDSAKMIVIRGHYSDREQNSSNFANLGLARAEEVKRQMILMGMDRNTIFTESVLDSTIFLQHPDSIWGGIEFSLSTIRKGMELSEELLLQPRNVYFETGKNSLLITPELENYFDQAKQYLSKNKDKKLSFTGHTDNVGKPEDNLKLSKSRAEFVANEIVKFGVLKSQTLIEGKGDQTPIEDNNTEENRSKNRRVEIRIQ